jgi:hypothetical protein
MEKERASSRLNPIYPCGRVTILIRFTVPSAASRIQTKLVWHIRASSSKRSSLGVTADSECVAALLVFGGKKEGRMVKKNAGKQQG